MPTESGKGASRGGRTSSSQSSQSNAAKSQKRDFELVAPTTPESPVNLTTFRSLLHEVIDPVKADFNELKADFNVVKSGLSEVKLSLQFTSDKLDDIKALTEKVNNLEKENKLLEKRLDKAEGKCIVLEDKIISLEIASRRSNLKFLNIAKTENGEHCDMLILDLCKKLGIPLELRDIERAHRTGPRHQANPPIIVKFINYRHRMSVLQAKARFKQHGILIVEDFPKEVVQRRKMFSPVLKAAYNSTSGYKARLQVDKLLLNSKLYSVDDLQKLPVDLRPDNLTTITQGNMTAFFTKHSKLSNHYAYDVTVDGQLFNSVEQCFMYKKATLFSDRETALAIMDCNDPAQAKSLVRRIQNFKADIWKCNRDDYIMQAVGAKFTQNPELANFLNNTGRNILIEANPSDSYWGVGLSLYEVDLWKVDMWKGSNKLGKLLTEIQDHME